MEKDELWLMTKDSQNKQIKTHIQFDIEQYVQSNIDNIYSYINYAFNLIDGKNLTILKKNIDYNLTGLKELSDNNLRNDSRLNNILYNLDNSFIEIVEWVNITLDYQNYDFYNLHNIIMGILLAEIQINKFEHIDYRTEQQALLKNNDIINMINKFNEKINLNIRKCLPFFYNNHIQNMKKLLINLTQEND